MKYKVIKKFYCPIKQSRVSVGEIIEVAEKNLEGYKQYIEIPKKDIDIKPKKK